MVTEHLAADHGGWPTPWGSLRNDRCAAVPIAEIERVRWAVELPEPGVHALSVGGDGTVYISTPHTLLAVSGSRIAWTNPAAPFGGCLVLANGLLVVSEAAGLAVRRISDAGLVTMIAAPKHTLPTVVNGRLVYLHSDSPHDHEVRAVDLDGTVHWARRLDFGSSWPPLAVGSLVVVADGEALRVFDPGGGVAWEYRGRRGPGFAGPLIGLPDGRLLVQYEANDDTATLVVDPVGHTMERIPTHLPLRRPMATNGSRLALAGWELEDAHGQLKSSLDLLSLPDGRPEDRIPLPTSLISLAASLDGVIAYAASPALDRWTSYRHFPGFEESTRCVVGLADGDGPMMQWTAPAPISGPIAVGVDGDLLVPVQRQLVSLGV